MPGLGVAVFESVTALDAPKVSYAFDLANNHYHLSLLYAGLTGLAAEGRIRLDWRMQGGCELDATATGGMVARMLVVHGDQEHRVALDLFDRSDTFDSPTLQWCDRYYKRSFYEPHVATIADENARKVRPFGMNYACRNKRVDRLLARSVMIQVTQRGFRAPTRVARRLFEQRNVFRTYASLPTLAEFKESPSTPRQESVLFQTRVWEPSEVAPDHAEEINGIRSESVRRLRAYFKSRFVGGLVPTRYAEEQYPDLLTNLSTKRRDFAKLVRSCGVLVYTRGLHHSVAFKLPEYLLSSGAIVTDPIRNELSRPLREGVNYASFGDLDELIGVADRLLNENASKAMRSANCDYATAHLTPCAAVAPLVDHR